MQSNVLSTLKNHRYKIKSIAIIGATDQPGLERIVFSHIIKNFNVAIYPINVNYEHIMNYKCYKNLLDLIEEIRKKSIKNIILVSISFNNQSQKKNKNEN